MTGSTTARAPREPSIRCEYDVVGYRDGTWIRPATGLADREQARAAVQGYRHGSPSVTWTVVRRTTTVREQIDDDLARPGPDHDDAGGRRTGQDAAGGGGAGRCSPAGTRRPTRDLDVGAWGSG